MSEDTPLITDTDRRILALTEDEAKAALMYLADQAGGDGQHRIDAAINAVLESTRGMP